MRLKVSRKLDGAWKRVWFSSSWVPVDKRCYCTHPCHSHHTLLAFLIHINSLMYFEKPSVRPKQTVEQQPCGVNGPGGGISCPGKIATLWDEIIFLVIWAEAQWVCPLLSHCCPWKEVRTRPGRCFPCWSACRCAEMQIWIILQRLSQRESVLPALVAAPPFSSLHVPLLEEHS